MTTNVVHPRRLRIRTDLRFGILVAAVLATGVFAFSVVAVASPEIDRIDSQVVQPCFDGLDARTAGISDSDARLTAKVALLNECMRPFILAEVKWVAAGLAAVFLLTVGLYLLHPWWLARRRRMTRLDPATDPDVADVVAELDLLAGQAGLAESPQWWLAPYAAGHGGQAFGLRKRYRVCLDAGLLIRYDLDIDGFRAVIRHELAHLTNQDVGRTYLTVALWWSFVATALSPFVAVTLNPDLLRHPIGWSSLGVGGSPSEITYQLVAVLVLTVTGYLVRNSILRARELCADAAAAQAAGTGTALTGVFAAMPWPPTYRRWQIPDWLARLGSHPAPADRAMTVTDPDRLNRTTWWELTGLGFMIGLALNNVSLLVGNLMERYSTVGLLVLATPAAMIIIGLLATALGQPNMRRGDPFILPAVLATGFAVSGVLSLVAAGNDSLSPLGKGFPPFGVSVVVLAAFMTVLAAWLHSVRRHLERAAAYRVVAGAAVVFGAPLVAVWFTLAYGASLDSPDLTILPQTGLTIGWYRELSQWLNGLTIYIPVIKLRATPFGPLGLILLWAVPVLLCGRWRYGGAGPRIDVRRAVLIGLSAGAVTILAALALPYMARIALPADVRRTPEGEPGMSFSVEYGLAYVAFAAIVLTVVAGIVAATSTRLRPVLVPLAVTTTAVLATVGYNLTKMMALCIGLDDAYKTSCIPEAPGPDSLTILYLSQILAWGAAMGVPAAFAGAGLGALRRRRAGAERPQTHGTVRQSARWKTAIGLGILAAIIPAGAALAVPSNISYWTPARIPEIPPPPIQPTGAVDNCLVGEWLTVTNKIERNLDGKLMEFASKGDIAIFRPDGTVIFDNGSGVTETARYGKHRYKIRWTGSTIASYRADSTTIVYSDAKAQVTKTLTLTVDGETRVNRTVTPSPTDDRYTCNGHHLHLSPANPLDGGEDYQTDLIRQ